MALAALGLGFEADDVTEALHLESIAANARFVAADGDVLVRALGGDVETARRVQAVMLGADIVPWE
jgi:hypothetical protein